MPFLFAITLFVSAALLFLLQPMIGKMVLPYLGGSPAVWNTCMVFFQAALLAGYLYAHGLTRRLPARRQVMGHAVLLLLPLVPLALLQLDVGRIAGGWLPPPSEANPIPWLLAVLSLAVGLPFFVLSTNAPLLQHWFTATAHRSAKDPYYLYAASNLGSMLALLSYPTVVEPNLSLSTQSGLWIAGYGLFLALVATCAVLVWRFSGRRARKWESGRVGEWESQSVGEWESQSVKDVENPTNFSHATLPRSHALTLPRSHALTLRRRLRWLALAFVPSSLMLGVTTYITTDLAAIPLLWIIPLALYLLSFVLVFSRLPAAVHRMMVVLLPVVIFLLIWPLPGGIQGYLSVGDWVLVDFLFLRRLWDVIILHLIALFVAAMVCHGELARTRPATPHLTEFYIWMSLGGVLGGVFNALLAPLLFDRVVEYPLVIAGACLLLPRLTVPSSPRWFRWADAGLAAALGVFGLIVGSYLLARTYLTTRSVARVPEPLRDHAEWFVENYGRDDRGVLLRERSFFGLTMIGERMEGDTVVRYMFHGTTIHGGQRFCTEAEKTARWVTPIAPAGAMDALVLVAAQQAWQDLRSQPLTYFHRQGRIGQVIQVLQEKRPRPRVAVLGMGAGTLAAYAEPGWQISFFEIDPAVVRIAEDPAYFTYVHDCRERIGDNNVKVILGDGRIKVWQQEDRTYDLLFMDAFSSDSVPVHLITKEALNIYFEKLAPGGILVVNIANRYLNLAPVLANLAEATGRQAVVGMDSADPAIGKFESNWVLLARDWADFGAIRDDVQRWPTDTDRHWRNLLRPPSAKDLTDSNLADWKKDFLFRSRFEQQLNEAAVRSWRQAIDRESPAEIRSWIQAEIDRAWERENARRQRIGVWRDDFSNLLRVLN